MKHILTPLLLIVFVSNASGLLYAQRWKMPVRKAAQRVSAQKNAGKAAVTAVTAHQITEAATRARKIWELQNIHAALDQKALARWAMQQSIRVQSAAYQNAAKDLAFIRQNAARIQASSRRDFLHVNSINYKPWIKDKNQILIAADWTPGARWQIGKLIKTVRQANPESRIIVASPFFAQGTRPYASGQYSRFHQENGPDLFFKEILHEPNVLLVSLSVQKGSSVKNHWRSWLQTVSPHYSIAAFGKTQEILIIIAPAKYIEGNASYLQHTGKAVSPWNKDETVTISLRTKDENNLTDFKWKLIAARGKPPLDAPYTNGWVLNAFVDQIAPQFSPFLGTDVIIRLHPQRPGKTIK